MKQIYLTDTQAIGYYGKKASPEFWDKHWKIDDLRKRILSCKWDGIFFPPLKRYLKSGSWILEGGCGRGRLVNALQFQGYNGIGIDFAKKTVSQANKAVPELDIRLGDVRNLSFDDNRFDGYISGGVIEHFWEGYEQIIMEMNRVIRAEGYLFLSFPYLSPIRMIKAKLRVYSHSFTFEMEENKESFYQFALNYNNVIKDLNKFDFKLIDVIFFDGIKGFKDELPLLKPLMQRIHDREIFSSYRPYIDQILKYFSSHCSLLIMQKLPNKK